MLDQNLMQQATKLVQAMDGVVDSNLPRELAGIVKNHSKGAAAAALASGWVPGAGGVAAAVTSAGFIWSMYGRIGAKIDVPFSENVLKSLASGVATNLAATFAGTIVTTTALSLFPGVGSLGASAIAGATCYAFCLASGYIYLKIMTKVLKEGIDPSTLGAQELKDMAASAAKESDVREVLKDARSDFRSRKKQGEFS